MLFYPEISIRNEMKKLMECAEQTYDYQLEQKRKRLQVLLQTDEDQQEREIMQKIQHEEATRLRDKQNSLLSQKEDRERQRAEFLKNKMIQQKINNCDEIRHFMQNKYHQESKKCQLAQIEDKMKLKQAKMDEERLWTDVHIRKYKLDLEKELRDKRDRRLLEEKTLQDIKVQIKEKTLRAAQEKVDLQEARCTSLPFPDHDAKLQQIGKCELAEKLREQISLKNQVQRNRSEQEQRVIKALHEAMARELEQEKAARRAEEDVLRKQKDQFYQYSKHVERQRQLEEGQQQKLILDAQQKFDQEALDKCRHEKQKRLQLAAIVYEGQRKQMAEMESRRSREREVRQQDALREREFHEKNRMEAARVENRVQTATNEYRELLKEQIKSAGLERERNKRANQQETNRLIEHSQKELSFVQSYVKGSFEAHFKQHPNVSLMKKKY